MGIHSQGFKCLKGLGNFGEAMQINVSSSHNIDGTLILPLFEGTDIVPEAHATGMHVALLHVFRSWAIPAAVTRAYI